MTLFLELLILHLVASAISLFGGLMMWRHRTQWLQHQATQHMEAAEKRFFYGQYRRRMQSSGMLAFLGLLLHASNEHLVAWQRAPAGFFVYVTVMLVLVAWIVLLALADYVASRLVHQTALSRLKEQQQQLEKTVLELRQKRS